MSKKIGELAARFGELVASKSRHAKEEKACAEEISQIEEQLLEEMGSEGLQNVKLASGMTLYRRVDKFVAVAEGFTKDQLVAELAQHDQTRDLVAPNYNAISLRSRLNEIEGNGETLPEGLSRMIRIVEKDRVGYRS